LLDFVRRNHSFLSQAFTVDSIIQLSHRGLAIHLTKESTLGADAGSHRSSWSSTQEELSLSRLVKANAPV
jgi:hypothetical protein